MKNALETIQDARDRGVMIYAAPNLTTPKTYKVEITELAVKESEFHPMKGGKFMPNKSVTDRIGEASGITFIAEHCETRDSVRDDDFGKRTVFISKMQGKVRLSDGSWRESTVEEYELDPKLRAMEECGGTDKGDGFAKKYLDFMKVGRARSSTGARLRVIRQLVGLPVSFEKEETRRPLLFSRVILNTDEIMSTPEGRQAAVLVALGATQMLYGSREESLRFVGQEIEKGLKPAENPSHEFDPSPAVASPPQAKWRSALRELREGYGDDLGQKAKDYFDTILTSESTPEDHYQDQFGKALGHLIKNGIRVFLPSGIPE